MNSSKKINGYKVTGCIVLPDGTHFFGQGFGFEGVRVGELCFNTAMTGYQEILTDPSYAGQIINFTFPHIGNTGINSSDNESTSCATLGLITRNLPTKSSNWKSELEFASWLRQNELVGVGNIDTRRLTRVIRSLGAPNIAICNSSKGIFDIEKMKSLALNTEGLIGTELTSTVTCKRTYSWSKSKSGKKHLINRENKSHSFKILAIDYGAKDSIFWRFTELNCQVTVVPANVSLKSVLNQKPDGIFLSNGPGDPMATFKKFGKVLSQILYETSIPVFGICLGHQLLGLALGGKTIKMPFGHHGANHPVKEIKSGKVEITSMNHGFAIDSQSLSKEVAQTHISLFDGSNCGIEILNRNAFSVQFHPEAGPGPKDSYYLFRKFIDVIETHDLRTQNS